MATKADLEREVAVVRAENERLREWNQAAWTQINAENDRLSFLAHANGVERDRFRAGIEEHRTRKTSQHPKHMTKADNDLWLLIEGGNHGH